MPHLAKCRIVAISPYSQSRAHQTEKLNKETADDYEQRTWREKAHYLAKAPRDGRPGVAGQVFIPPTAIKNAMVDAAKFSGRQIPGRGKSTYTKHFASGVMILDEILLTDGQGNPILKDELESERVHCNADGVRGSGKRVWRNFPRIDDYDVEVPIFVYDDTITEEVFETVLSEAGTFIGIGRFRPQNLGHYGRFAVENIEWSELT